MIKAVLFDLDGTLLNRDLSVQKFINKQYERLNGALGHIAKNLYTNRFLELDCGGYVWKDKVYQQLVEDYNISELTWGELLDDYLHQFKNSCVPFSNLIWTLEELKNNNLRLGIITNGKGKFQMDNIKALGIQSYFKTILISEWEEMKKPDPQLFKKASDELNVLPAECVFVGDHPEKDVKAAQRVGMKGIWKKDDQWGDVEADYVVEDLRKIPLIIDELNS